MTALGDCTNCESRLHGRYCSQCGQKTESSRPTFGHFFGEAIESLTHADSRLWKTLWFLLSKPGLLTTDFFEGKRSRYLPPIRLYIVLSVVFFFLRALSSSQSAVVSVHAEKPTAGRTIDFELDCTRIRYDGPLAGHVRDRLRRACDRVKETGGIEALGRAFLANIPKAMGVLLPLFAMCMLLFWWNPRRLYAEHVLFLIHNHSAVFAALSISLIFDRAVPEFLKGALGVIIPIYLLWYTWRGLRNFYGDSPGFAVLKLSSLTVLYLVCAALVLTVTGIATAVTF